MEKITLWLAIYRMLYAVDYYPAVVGATVRRTMDVVNAGNEPSPRGEICLPIRKDRDVHWSRDASIQIVIDDDFNKLHVASGHGHTQREDFMIAVRASVLRARGADGDSADHDVIDVVVLSGMNQL